MMVSSEGKRVWREQATTGFDWWRKLRVFFFFTNHPPTDTQLKTAPTKNLYSVHELIANHSPFFFSSTKFFIFSVSHMTGLLHLSSPGA